MKLVPFLSSIDAGFWYQLSDLKLNQWKLDTSTKKIKGHFSNALKPGLPCLFNISEQAFKAEDMQLPRLSHVTTGDLIVVNTKEDFSKLDKKQILHSSVDELVQNLQTTEIFNNPELLTPFTLVCFADLKKYTNVYWCCFPSIHLSPEINSHVTISPLPDKLKSILAKTGLITNTVCAIDCTEEIVVDITSLSSRDQLNEVIFMYADPSTDSTGVGWPCRNYINALLYHFGSKLKTLDVLCYRNSMQKADSHLHESVLLSVPIPADFRLYLTNVSSSGWEKNKDKLIPKLADLSKLMDPKKLSRNAVELNLKLMKWRIAPELDLESIAQQKCLLLGAGTLGCNVARLLLAWGVQNIMLVDHGRVSYSNPVRQSLFVFDDAMGGSSNKAERAAAHLKSINPSCEILYSDISIPMPGHPIAEIEKEEVTQNIQALTTMIMKHDCIFLLLDTREARWLPTLLGKACHKLVINAALGFDSYLVMRHGMLPEPPEEGNAAGGDEAWSSKLQEELGCYFCSDVMAPGNSLSDRTLDQQCTVTRPGTSMIASSLAVELFVSCVTNSKGIRCPADVSEDSLEPLGACPQQIRGWLSQSFRQITPRIGAYSKCVACSKSVIDAFYKRGNEFLFEVFNDPSYLEDVTGLSKLKAEIDENFADEIIVMSDDDDDHNDDVTDGQ